MVVLREIHRCPAEFPRESSTSGSWWRYEEGASRDGASADGDGAPGRWQSARARHNSPLAGAVRRTTNGAAPPIRTAAAKHFPTHLVPLPIDRSTRTSSKLELKTSGPCRSAE